MPQNAEDMGRLADEMINDLNQDDNADLGLDDLDDELPGEEDFEHKYNVLKGKYDTETERMSQMLSQAMAEKEALKLQIGTKTTPSAQDTFDSDPEIQSLVQEYPSLAKGIKAMADKIVSQKLKQTEEHVGAATIETRKALYDAQLEAKVSDWRELNGDKGFIDWLQQVDRYTGATRHQLLMHAYQNFDAETSAKFFNDYKAERGDVVDSKTRKQNLRMGIDTAGGVVPDTAKTKTGFISRADISQFYRDRAMGKFSGSEEEAAKIESRILQAVKNGKVR